MLRPQGILDKTSEISGAGLETLFFQSVLALIAYHQLDFKPYYWRTASGVEVDFVLYGQQALFVFEIKHTQVIQGSMLTGLKHFKQDYPMAMLYILYLGTQTLYLADGITAIPFAERLQLLPKILHIPSPPEKLL